LKNQPGKCLELITNGTNQTGNEVTIIQSNYNPRRNGHLLKPNEGHICNEFNECLSLSIDWNPVNLTLAIIISDYDIESLLQEWKFEKSCNIITQNHCLETFLDSAANETVIKMGTCGMGQKSQSRYFEYVGN